MANRIVLNTVSYHGKGAIEEIPNIYLKGVTFHYAENILDVWNFALTDEKIDNPVQFSIDEGKENGKHV